MGAAGFFLNHFRRIFIAGVDGQVGAHRGRQLQLSVVDVDSDHFGVKHILRILQREVTQPAEAVDGDPLARFDVGDLDRFVGGDARAGDAAGGGGVEAVRNFYRVVGGDDALFRHAAIDGIAGVFHRAAERLVAVVTVIAVAAAFEEPRHAGAVARLQGGDARADFLYHPDPFMAENDAGFIAKIAVFHVQVSMTHAAAFHFQQRFAVFQRAQRFFRDVNLMVVGNNSCLHACLLVGELINLINAIVPSKD